ncbi:MAG: hypothetical protein PHW72_02115 [Candidatus Pacebacteria bacterium]|nr:hypothetical protein [Candidatus Paceibacterota bacterium]
MNKEKIEKDNNAFSEIKTSIFIFLAVVLIMPFWESERALVWQDNNLSSKSNIFKSFVYSYAQEAEKFKYMTGINSGEVDEYKRELFYINQNKEDREVGVEADKESSGGPGVLLMGDSFMGPDDGIGAILEQEISKSYKDAIIDHIIANGQGLAQQEHQENWITSLEEYFSQNEADWVIVQICLINGGHYSTEEWGNMYGPGIRKLLDFFAERGVGVVWAGAPLMKNERLSNGPKNVNPIIENLIGEYENAYFVDTWDIFMDSEGKYSSFLLTQEGYRKARNEDGMHYLFPGAKAVTAEIMQLLNKIIPSP